MTRIDTELRGQPLERVSLFSGLTADVLVGIQKRCSWRHYELGEPIVDYLDTSDDVHFIVAGEVRVSLYSSRREGSDIHRSGPW